MMCGWLGQDSEADIIDDDIHTLLEDLHDTFNLPLMPLISEVILRPEQTIWLALKHVATPRNTFRK